jgi:hypothetical protein
MVEFIMNAESIGSLARPREKATGGTRYSLSSGERARVRASNPPSGLKKSQSKATVRLGNTPVRRL